MINQATSISIIVMIGLFALIRAVLDIKRNKYTLLFNLILGGASLILINIGGIQANLNIITGSLVTLYGIPGVALIVALKLIFKMI